MTCTAASVLTLESDSKRAATEALADLRQRLGEQPLKVVVVYMTVNHEQHLVLERLRAELPDEVILLGCSVQGVTVEGAVEEGAFVLGLLGLAGRELEVAVAFARDLATETRRQGEALGRQIRSTLNRDPKIGIVLWDPLCGADTEQLLAGIASQIAAPLVGGGAGQPWGKVVRTYQYFGAEVVQHGAILCALAGPFDALVGVCHGTSPTGVAMTLTKAEGNALLEFDGRPALDVWREMVGCSVAETMDQDYISNWALGVQRRVTLDDGTEQDAYFIRAAFSFDFERRATIVQAAIPEGSRIMLHHRTVDAVTEGTRAMAQQLQAQLASRRPWAVLGFECGARTNGFLGLASALEENRALQAAIAPGVPWLGMSAWGEIAPVGGSPAFHNYTYPVVLLVQ